MAIRSCLLIGSCRPRSRALPALWCFAYPEIVLMKEPTLIQGPTRVEAAGNKPKLIDEYVGSVNSGTADVSIAHMRSPAGWEEPGQAPEFDEFTVVMKGMIRVEYRGGSMDVRAGQAVIAHKGLWVRYSTPEPEGAEYFAICLPAFSIDAVHRDS